MNSKKNLITSLTLFTLVSSVFAESKSCSDYYKELLPKNRTEKFLDTLENIGDLGMSTGVVGVGISVVGSSTGLIFSSGVGALAFGISSLAETSSEIKHEIQLNNLNELQKQAESGDGSLVREVRLNAIKEDSSFNLSISEVADLILITNQVGIGCKEKVMEMFDTSKCVISPNGADREVKCEIKKDLALDQYVPVSKIHEVIIQLSRR